MKKVFIISSVFLGIALGLWAVYNFVFKNSASNPVADPKQKAEAEKQAAEIVVNPEGRLEVVVSDTVLGATLDQNSLLYYSGRDRAIKRASLDGGNPVVLFSDFPGTPTRVVWSPRRNNVALLIDIPDQGPFWHSLDLSAGQVIPLKKEMSRIAWTNIGESILYQFTDGGNTVSLNIADPDGSDWRKLTDLAPGDYFIAPVPQSSLVSFWKRPNGLEENRLEVSSIVGQERKTIFANRFGADFLWSENGSRLLVGSVSEKGKSVPSLGTTNENGGEFRDLGIPTLVSKAVWSADNTTIYYALPGSFPSTAVLPNDYFSRTVTTKDTFWKMNVRTGKRERLIPLEEINATVDATDLFLSGDETTLFFTDRTSGKLYRINL